MVLEFSVKNFRSIHELQTLSFRATGLRSSVDLAHVDRNNICPADGENVLKTIGIYGANASGKSNVIRAFTSFLEVVGAEATSESNLSKVSEPFFFQPPSNNDNETFFQIVLLLKGKKYRYGFTTKRTIEVDVDSREKNLTVIDSEWLQGTYRSNMKFYFTRKKTTATLHEPIDNGKIPTKLPYGHSLFLTHASAFDSEGECTMVRNFIKQYTITNISKGFTNFRWHSFIALEKETRQRRFLDLLNQFNLKYDDVYLSKAEGDEYDLSRVNFIKNVSYKGRDFRAVLNLEQHESEGTQRLFEIAGFLLRAFSMETTGLVILDEIDSNFHPFLVMKIVQMFNNPQFNSYNCQLLFTSHDTNLLSPEILRRDQIYFTEKSLDESTRLYSLADLRGIRNDADFAKQYLAGFYGGLPIMDTLINSTDN